jgi:hypothetical protein
MEAHYRVSKGVLFCSRTLATSAAAIEGTLQKTQSYVLDPLRERDYELDYEHLVDVVNVLCKDLEGVLEGMHAAVTESRELLLPFLKTATKAAAQAGSSSLAGSGTIPRHLRPNAHEHLQTA